MAFFSSQPARLVVFVLPLILVLTGCAREAYRDLRPEHWAWWGADPAVTSAVIDRVRESSKAGEFWDTGTEYGPGNWTWEFDQVAEQVLERATRLEDAGDLPAASEAYDQASVYFGLAKYPHIARTAAEDAAFERQLMTYRKAMVLAGYGYEVIHTRLDGTTVTGLLHLPRPSHPAPYALVIGTNGLDVFAAESGPLVRDLLDRGIAVLMSDIPGTGMNSATPLEPDFDRLWLALLERLRGHAAIDADRVGVFGMSFGGNAAVKLAMTQQQALRAVANICGPLHQVFTLSTAQVSAIDPMYRDGLVDRLHLPDGEPATIVAAASRFSLISQGVLGQGQHTEVPVLSMNARNDYVAPESDLQLITDASRFGSIVWSGSDNHCPQFRERDMPLVAQFFEKYLTGTEPVGDGASIEAHTGGGL